MDTLKVVNLCCEYKENPIGIDVKKPRISWQISSKRRNVIQSAYQIQVSSSDKFFDHIVWDSGKVHTDLSVNIEYEGEPLQSRTRYYFRIRVWDQKGIESEWSEPAYWETGFLRKEEWLAEWIKADHKTKEIESCDLLRKTFTLNRKVKNARIYATCLGLYELHLNGKRVGDWLFTPGWTSYHYRLQYQVYDVTDLLMVGENAIGAILADGWYKGYLGWHSEKEFYGDERALLFQMHIEYEDGNEEVIVSDDSWKSTTGPILMSQIYHGETYDARLEREGWNKPSYDDSTWSTVQLHSHTKDILIAQENVPTKVIQDLKPLKIIKTPAGETVIDFGQNLVGWVRFSVIADAGTEIILKHAEVLDNNGNFYVGNLRSAQQTIRYICKGHGTETFEPHFTFQGFRYVKVEGYPGKLSPDAFIARVIHSDMKLTGEFECSNKLINQLQHNILWGMKGNFLDIPTDCPQRDERLGWTGDAQVFIRTACFIMNVAPFFNKWLKDLAVDQFTDGRVPHEIPFVLESNDRGSSSSAWGDAAVICPWTIYECYGDKRILEQQYTSMKAWVEYIRSQGENEYTWETGFHYGDWLALDAEEGSYTGATPKDLIATAFFAYSTSLVAKTAEILGNSHDANIYQNLYKEIVKHFNQKFVTPDGQVVVLTQTAHVLPLMFGLVTGNVKKKVVQSLVDLIKENNYHLTTGFVGTPYLLHVLSQNGYTDVAYKLLLQKDYPSWIYPITKGATTIWEHWDGIREDGSFWSDDMNSFNHYAYGSVGDWLYRVVAGINSDIQNPGYKHIVIHPHPQKDLKFARASLKSMYGEIRSEWEYGENDIMQLLIRIPENTTATVILPFAKVEDVMENGHELSKAHGILKYVQIEQGVQIELTSGTYCFDYLVQ